MLTALTAPPGQASGRPPAGGSRSIIPCCRRRAF